tara:strand:- start:3706 stop:4290 length:585 start_codon:yes stop_codon:yes gene_type:complete
MNSKLFQIGMIYMTFGLGGCGHDAHGHDHDHEHEHEAPGIGEAHQPQHVGGFLVAASDHVANVEIVPNFEKGEMQVFLYDGCVEKSVRSEQAEIPITLQLADGPREFVAMAQANELTGETVGDTSEFLVKDDALKGAKHVTGTIQEVHFLGARYTNLAFNTDPATHHAGYFGIATEHETDSNQAQAKKRDDDGV